MPTVLVSPPMIRRDQGPYYELLVSRGFEVLFPADKEDTADPAVLLRLLENADCMIASTEPLPREILQKSKLRVIARMGVGYNSIDLAAANDLQIAVTITPGTLEQSVAEHTVALMLGVARDIVGRDREVRTGNWTRHSFPRLAGKTCGLIGLGRIGRAVVPKVQGLGMRVAAFDPFAAPALAGELGIELASSQEELLATADVVSLHLPHTPHTEDLINADALAKMKPGAILINTSRGGLVDENALCEALSAGKLLGAALDVFKQEPLPANSPLLAQPRLLLCTHMGGLDCESKRDAGLLAAQCLVDLYEGRRPDACWVNGKNLPNWKWK